MRLCCEPPETCEIWVNTGLWWGDLLFASSGVEPEIVAQAEELEIAAGISLPIATTGHLIAQKLLARDDRLRPQDFDDLKVLLREASPEDRTPSEREGVRSA